MQTLGLSGETKRSDGRLKSIFWPTVENAWDVDYLGRQGFWICLLVAFFQIALSLVTGNLIAITFGAAAALVFMAGGLGVRQSNWPAAVMVFAIYFVGLLFTMVNGRLPGILYHNCRRDPAFQRASRISSVGVAAGRRRGR